MRASKKKRKSQFSERQEILLRDRAQLYLIEMGKRGELLSLQNFVTALLQSPATGLKFRDAKSRNLKEKWDKRQHLKEEPIRRFLTYISVPDDIYLVSIKKFLLAKKYVFDYELNGTRIAATGSIAQHLEEFGLGPERGPLLLKISGTRFYVKEAFPVSAICKLVIERDNATKISIALGEISFVANKNEDRSRFEYRLKRFLATSEEVWRGVLIAVSPTTGLGLLTSEFGARKVTVYSEHRCLDTANPALLVQDFAQEKSYLFSMASELNLRIFSPSEIMKITAERLALLQGGIEQLAPIGKDDSSDFDSLLFGMTKTLKEKATSDLLRACETLDFMLLVKSLAKGADINASRNSDGATPLHMMGEAMFNSGLSAILGEDIDGFLPNEAEGDYSPFGGRERFVAKVKRTASQLDPLRKNCAGLLASRSMILRIGHTGVAKISENVFRRISAAEQRAAQASSVDYFDIVSAPKVVIEENFDPKKWALEP